MKPTKKWFVLSLILFALGLMSKPMLVTLPFVLLLLDFWPFGRLHITTAPALRAGLRKLIVEKIPFFALAATSCVITLMVQPIASMEGFPLVDRMSNSLTAYLGYIEKTLWPMKLSVFYPFPIEPNLGVAFLALVLLAGITVVAVRSAKTRPYLLVGWFWYLGMLVPVIGWVQVGTQAMADRYTYLPIVGLFVMIVWGATALLAGREQKSTGIGAIAAIAVVACGILASRQIARWRDSKTLFTYAAEVDAQNFMAWSILADHLRVDKRYAEAEELYNRSISIRPDSEIPWHGLALCRSAVNRMAEAEQAFQEGLKRNPNNAHVLGDYAEFLLNLGRLDEAQAEVDKARHVNPYLVGPRISQMLIYQKQNRLKEAMSECKEILRLDPANEFVLIRLASIYSVVGDANNAVAAYRDIVRSSPTNANARVGLGLALTEMNDLSAAEPEFLTVLQSEPKNPYALDGLGFVLARKGQLDEAKAKFSESLRLNPTNALTHLHYAMCLTSQDQAPEAIAEYRKALELEPNRVVALNNLAWALASHPDPAIRNGKEAVEFAERACQLTNNRQPFYLGTLAAAYAEAGRFDEAIATGEKARDLANELGSKDLADRNEQLLQYYHVHQPFHVPVEKPGK